MKNFKLISVSLVLISLFLITSCSKDRETGFVGTWNTSDGGTLTFNSDGTGLSNNCPYFGCSIGSGSTFAFKWNITSDDQIEVITHSGPDFTYGECQTLTTVCKVISKKKATIGTEAGGLLSGFGLKITLTK